MRLRWLGVLAIAVGCGHHARVHAPGEIWLSKIEIKGNKTIPEDDLTPGLALARALRDGLSVDPYQLSLDTKRIRGAYLRQGFFEAKVDGEIQRNDNVETVVFTIVEGPRSKARVSVTGLPPELPEATVLDKLELKEGEPFDYELYDDGKEVVKTMVEEVGYPFVDTDESVVTVDRAARVAAASYRVVLSGPRAAFGPVTITGLADFPDLDRAIRGRLSFREGDVYTPKALAESTRALYDLGRFAQVRIDIDRTKAEAIVPVTIAVRVAGQVEVKAGGGLGYEPLTYEARVRGSLSYVPYDYPLWTFSVDGRAAATVDHSFGDAQPKFRIFFNGQRLEFLRPFIIADAGFGLDFFTVEAYTATGALLRLGGSAPLGARWFTLQTAWSFSFLSFSGVSGLIDDVTEVRLGLRDTERNGRFEQALVADRRDKPLEPRKGYYLGLRSTEGGQFAGGAFNYLELQPDLRAYLPVRKASVLAFHVRAASFFGDVPVTQRLFSGGAQGHRGFSARSLAPSVCGSADPMAPQTSFLCFAGTDQAQMAKDSVLIGGTALLETGAELRLEIGKLSSSVSYGTTLFVDGGDVTNALSDIDLTNLYWAVGVGGYLKFGGFKIRVDIGRRITRIGPDDLQYHSDSLIKNTTFSLGVGETY